MSAIGVAFAVAGWVLFGILLVFVGLQRWTERAEAAATDGEAPTGIERAPEAHPKGIDFDRDPEARRRFLEGGAP